MKEQMDVAGFSWFIASLSPHRARENGPQFFRESLICIAVEKSPAAGLPHSSQQIWVKQEIRDFLSQHI
ncbi:MAG: hypothetical protein WBE74_22945, partial [Terracidiphilus sp.]